MSPMILNPYRHATGGGGTPPSFVGVESTSEFADDATLITVAKHVDVQEGDLLLFIMQTRLYSRSASGPEGSGWTERAHVQAAGAEIVTTVWEKSAGPSEAASYGLGITDVGTSASALAAVAAFRSVGANEGANSAGGSSLQTDAPSVAGTDGGLLVCVWGLGADNIGTYDSFPGAMGEVLRMNPDGEPVKMAIGWEILAATGATGTRTIAHTGLSGHSGAASVSYLPS